jgi:hypothetical protein
MAPTLQPPSEPLPLNGQFHSFADLERLTAALGTQRRYKRPDVALRLRPASKAPQRVARLDDVDRATH